jgi:hypothetical protein
LCKNTDKAITLLCRVDGDCPTYLANFTQLYRPTLLALVSAASSDYRLHYRSRDSILGKYGTTYTGIRNPHESLHCLYEVYPHVKIPVGVAYVYI